MQDIVLTLHESSDAKAFPQINLIHSREFNTAKNIIANQIKRIDSNKDRTHDTITISGTRGSGKTSFLLSLLNEYKNSKDISVLPIIDPTLIEEKGHIFLNVISLIKDEVDKVLDKIDLAQTTGNYQLKKEWQSHFRQFAHGLPTLDKIGGNGNEISWQDPEFIMNKGLTSVSAARKLEENFHSFISNSLKVLEKKAFLIAFDDIDIDFRKGWAVIETIRKYFATPEIISLLSGDLELYSKVIRKTQWQNFGKALLINEGDRLGKTDQFNELVTQLEGQYLQKVMKPERRIYLTTLKQKLMLAGNISNITITTGDATNDIRVVYQEILASFGVKNLYQADAYSSFLMNLPLRTQIRFLTEFTDAARTFTDINISAAFLSDLFEKKVDVNLVQSSPKLLTAVILQLLLQEKALSEAYQLQPTTIDSSLNSSLVALSFLFSKTLANRSSYLIFEFFIKIGYTRNLLSTLGYREEHLALKKNESEEINRSQLIPSIEGLCKHAGILQDKVLRDITGNITAYMRAYLNTDGRYNAPWNGTIPLRGLAQVAKEGLDNSLDRIDSVFKSESIDHQVLGYIPLSICKYPNSNESLPAYSIYGLIATIGELIKIEDINGDITKALLELSEVRTYVMPDFDRMSSVGENETSEIGVSSAGSPEILATLILDWVRSFPASSKVSPHTLGKVSTRFFYAMNSIETRESSETLGNMMHIRIIALLNAILLEEGKENPQTIRGLNINNPNKNEKIFIHNLRAATDSDIIKDLNLSRWMLSCPLLLAYINPTPELKEQLVNFTDSPLVAKSLHLSVYTLLEQVSKKENSDRPSRKSPAKKRIARKTVKRNELYEAIIMELRKRKAPVTLFKVDRDRKKTSARNIIIRKKYADIFPSTTSLALRTFRSYYQKTQSDS